MAKLTRKVGSTSQTVEVFLRDSSSTTGAGLTGLVFNTASLTAYYVRTRSAAVAITLVTQTPTGAFSSGGFVAVDGTNTPGLYRLDIPDAALASGADSVVIMLKGATNLAPCLLEIDLDGQVDVTSWNGTAVPSPATAGVPDVNAKAINNVAATSVTTVNANLGTTQPTNYTGTGASALVKSDMVDIAGAAVSTSTAQIGVNVIQSAGTTVHNSDGTLASATASTVTFPTTDSAGNTIPDDTRFQYTIIQIVAGTGIGQVVALTTKNGVRTFNILSGTAPVLLDATSQYTVLGSWRSEVDLINGVTTSSVTTINANVGTTQPLNFTGTGASALVQVDTRDFGGIAGTFSSGKPAVTLASADVTGNVAANVAQWSGTNVAGAIPPDVVFTRSGTAQAGGASTITLDAGASAVNNFYQNEVVFIRSGTGAGQSALITTYNGTTKVATINGTWATNPDATSVFSLLPFGAISASVAGNVTVGGYAAGQDPATLVLDATAASHNTAGTIGADINLVGTNLDAKVSTRSAPATAQTIDFTTALPVSPTAGTVGEALKFSDTRLDAAVSTRMATFTLPTNFSALAITVGGAVTAGTVSDKTGYALSSAGLDSVTIETSLNARQALSIIASASAGVLAGAATTSVTIAGAGVPATNRVTATCDSSGNRSAVTLNPPA